MGRVSHHLTRRMARGSHHLQGRWDQGRRHQGARGSKPDQGHPGRGRGRRAGGGCWAAAPVGGLRWGHPLTRPLQKSLLLVDAGRPIGRRRRLDQIPAIATRLRDGLTAGCFEDLVDLWAEEWEARRGGVAGWPNPEAERIAGIVRAAGGAARVCGAGRGGILALWATPGAHGPAVGRPWWRRRGRPACGCCAGGPSRPGRGVRWGPASPGQAGYNRSFDEGDGMIQATQLKGHVHQARQRPLPGRGSPAQDPGEPARNGAGEDPSNLKTGAISDHRFRSVDVVERAILDETEMEYLYRDGDMYHFMNNETYEQAGALRRGARATPSTT